MRAIIFWLMLCFPAFGGETIVLVLDASGSMEEKIPTATGSLISKMEAAKIAIIEGANAIKGRGAIAGIVCFGNVPQKWMLEPVSIDDADPNLTSNVLSQIKPGGGTPLAEYTKLGADKLLELREKSGNIGRYRLVIVTDGEATDSDKLLQEYVQDAVSRGILVDTIGIDMKQSHALATKSNSYQDARDTKSLSRAIKNALENPGMKISEDINPKDFLQNGSFPDEISPQLIYSLSTFRNHPVGEEIPPIIMNEGGNLIQVEVEKPISTARFIFNLVLCIFVATIAISTIICLILNFFAG